jgi:hypothetical protein
LVHLGPVLLDVFIAVAWPSARDSQNQRLDID